MYLCISVFQAFKLFDMDGDGMITKDELKKLVEKVIQISPFVLFW